MRQIGLIVAIPALAVASSADAAVSIARGNSAPTYTSTLNFDEPGGPVGSNVPGNSWTSLGIASLVSGEGSNTVGNFTGSGIGTGNSFNGPFGVFVNMAQDVTAMSFQYWDDSGPATPFGGGASVIVLNDGVEITSLFHSPVIAGNTNSWFNITTTGGSTFDEVRMVGFGFFPQAYTDNISWNSVPAPGSLALLGFGGVCALRRRR